MILLSDAYFRDLWGTFSPLSCYMPDGKLYLLNISVLFPHLHFHCQLYFRSVYVLYLMTRKPSERYLCLKSYLCLVHSTFCFQICLPKDQIWSCYSPISYSGSIMGNLKFNNTLQQTLYKLNMLLYFFLFLWYCI